MPPENSSAGRWNSLMSGMQTLSSRIFRLRSKRRSRAPEASPWLLSVPDYKRLMGFLLEPGFLPAYRQVLELQEEQEVTALFAATPDQVPVALGRLKLLDQLFSLPERLASLNKEHYDRAKRESGDAPDPAKFHLGSPFFWNKR